MKFSWTEVLITLGVLLVGLALYDNFVKAPIAKLLTKAPAA